MKIKSALATSWSGSIGGLTGAHNRGGLYIRSRTIPTDPASAAQINRRSVFGGFSAAWSSALTDAQREAWNLYASNVPITDALGDSIFLSGQQWFVGANALRAQAGVAAAFDGPTNFSRPSFTAPTITSIDTDGDINFTFDDSDNWANETGGALLVFAGRPQSPGINFFKGPFRFADSVDGDDSTPPASPANIASPFTQNISQKVWVRMVAVAADGRFSPASVIGPTAVTTAE